MRILLDSQIYTSYNLIVVRICAIILVSDDIDLFHMIW